MRRYVCVSAIALAAALAADIAATPVLAASVSTDAFRANLRLQAQFLIQASKLARAYAASEKTKKFADAQAAEQIVVLNELDRRPASEEEQLVAAADTGGDLATGRSIAAGPIDVATYAPPSGVGVLLPAAAVSLDHLANSKGTAFDSLYAGLAGNVLINLAGFYSAYARTGDDPALRAIAAHELPRVEADRVSLRLKRPGLRLSHP